MKCFVCNADTPAEVCNSCIRSEKKILEETWIHKEGFLGKIKEDCKITLSNYRLSGIGLICRDEDSFSNGRYDTFTHYVGNIDSAKICTIANKPALMLKIINPQINVARFIYFPSIADPNQMLNKISIAIGKKL